MSLQIIQKKRAKTQFSQDNFHLCVQLKKFLPQPARKISIKLVPPSDDSELATNFSISINNPYCFILLHLRNKTNKNPININIPQVCIFHDRTPYDIVQNVKGYIRGHQHLYERKLRMKDMFKIFKDAAQVKNLPKNQQIVAAFAQKQMLMLSDNDMYDVIHKAKQDLFFKKLRYIRNKMPATNQNLPITVAFSEHEQQTSLIKLATLSLLNSISDEQCMDKIKSEIKDEEVELKNSQTQYLKFLNIKIVQYLNYQHNIRIKKCEFVYLKTVDNQYQFIDAHKLQFSNLTGAILQRQRRLLMIEQQRNKILIMTPQKQQKYRSCEHSANVKTYENIMHGHFNSIMNKLNINKVSDNKLEEVKNQIAFKKLHPKSRFTYTQIISSNNFTKLKDQILQNETRKPLTMPSRYVRRFYNKAKKTSILKDHNGSSIRNRIKTEFVNVFNQ